MKIDTNTINGYEQMSDAEKLEALKAYEFEAPDVDKLKNALSRANSEASSWKKKYNETLSAGEQEQQAKEDKLKSLTEELEALKKKNAVSDAKASYLSLGYNDELATSCAECLINGDRTKLFENQKKFLELRDKAQKAEILKQNPKPVSGGEPSTKMTRAEFTKLSAKERIEFFKAHPDEYHEIYKE